MSKNDQSILKTTEIFNRLTNKLNFSLKNRSDSILGLDILRDSIKRDLLLLTSLFLEKKIISLVQSDSTFFDVQELRQTFLTLVCQISETFLAKNYGRTIKIRSKILNKCLYNKVTKEDIQILFQIPVCSLVNPECSLFRATFSPVYNFATDFFLESLFENLVIEISNCVLFMIVSEFSDIYNVRQNLYKANFLSVRNLERFKNNFVWQTTIKSIIRRPKNIYDSRYRLWIIRASGIYCKVVYANRSKELSKLRKVPLATVTFVEFLDFLSSRFDEFFYMLGNGLRFTLTSVIGQVIGLVWRGIIEGLKR